ncbi:hypothetical protein EJ03DRAFT_156875 [Teratosphaeria nubilosa]|uniref:Uncharacterized protein n=1 Tax=Teratosphaeria nubilosa TaxID=161662 RepID=A0A6G1L3G5_9PEZI|nr:hypothetical protein EJ03DRAFT_156875 [Teratosphaeria nubilosa]
MSDPGTEPGAPTGGATDIPAASEKSVAQDVKKRVPKLAELAATPDTLILRVNKLLASPGGLSSFLSTFNYTLYLLTYLETKSTPLKIKLYQLLNKTDAVPATNGPSSIAALATMLSTTRTTLRLFGLFPMYAWLRQLMQGPKPGQDQVLYATSVTQCLLYMTYQFLENVGLLTDNKVLPASYTARWTASVGGKTSRIYLWSYRAWLGGVLCDFVRLFREAQLERKKRGNRSVANVAWKEEAKENDEKWWRQLVVPLFWTPVAVQFAREGGIPGFNLGWMGVLGGIAGLGRTAELWAATAA